MDVLTLLLGGVLLLVAIIVLRSRKNPEFARKLNKLNGPPSYPVVGTVLPILFKKRNELFSFFIEGFNEFRPIFRTWNIGEGEVHLLRPEDVEVILKSSEHIDKGHFYKLLHEWLGTGLLTSTGQKWFTHRKMITPTFHFKILDSFVEVFSEKSEILVDKLKEEVGSQEFNVYPYVTRCALDIICETAMGTPIYAQEERGSEYVKAVYDLSEMLVLKTFRPWLNIKWLSKFSSIGKRYEECLKVVHGLSSRVIRERKAQLEGATAGSIGATTSSDEDAFIGKKKRKAFLDLLLEASKGADQLTDEELREEVDTFMFEGHDTTSSGMSWTLFLLGLHPDIQEKVYEEQERIFQGSDRSITMKDLNEMKYLERVVKESNRLYPPVPIIARKLHKDVKIAGYEIPAECSVLLHIYEVHRNPEQFPNPEEFDPDNFLPERVAKRHPYAYIPFSAGPRNCIGQKFALLEEKTVLSYISRYYKIQSLDKREDVKLMGELILRPEKGVRLNITPRKPEKKA